MARWTLYVFNYRLILSVNDVLGDNDDIVFLDYVYGYIVEANENYLLYSDVVIPDVPNGNYYVGMEFDYTNTIDESDESDNWRIDADQLEVNGPSDVDLTPSDVPLVSTGNYRLGAIADPSDNFDESDETNNDGLDGVPVAITAPNMAPGWYDSGAILDPANAIPETNENNNKGSDVFPQQFQN